MTDYDRLLEKYNRERARSTRRRKALREANRVIVSQQHALVRCAKRERTLRELLDKYSKKTALEKVINLLKGVIT